MTPTTPTTPKTLIALGSNLGDSPRLLTQAMDALQSLSQTPILRSSFWASEPVNCPPGSPLFVNAAIALHPIASLSPESLLLALQNLERELGRTPKRLLNEPRPIDLDLIAWGHELRHSPTLTLPHPLARSRRFVLTPLCEIAPEFCLPPDFRSIQDLATELGPPASRTELSRYPATPG